MENTSVQTRGFRISAKHLLVVVALFASSLVVLDPGVATGADGSAPDAAGVGTAAALKAENCDPATKLIKVPTVLAPPCVRPLNGR